jgi:hypothetical protein
MLLGYNNTPSKGVSRSLGVFPRDIATGNAWLRRHGITSAWFDLQGLAHWSDKNGQKALLRYHDAIDTDGENRKD